MYILSVYIFQVGVNQQLHVGAKSGVCELVPRWNFTKLSLTVDV